MPATEAQILANRTNAARSTGPKTLEGKDASRANAYKHGLTGAGVVVPEAVAAEVDRRVGAFRAELKPSGLVGETLVRLAATLAVRMERCAEQETAALADRVRRAEADFVPPEGSTEAVAARLRAEAGKIALFDPSKEATLLRKYEAAARSGFFRALKELRTIERPTKPARVTEPLASILPEKSSAPARVPARPESAPLAPPKPSPRVEPIDFGCLGGRVDVPIAIGRRR